MAVLPNPLVDKPLRLILSANSEFPAGDFGSNRQAISVETDRPFRSKAAPDPEGVSVPASAYRRCSDDPTLCWLVKASIVVFIIHFGCRGGLLWIM